MFQTSISFSNVPLISPSKPEREITKDNEQYIEKGLCSTSTMLDGNNIPLAHQNSARLSVYHDESRYANADDNIETNESNANSAIGYINHDISASVKTDPKLFKSSLSNGIAFRQSGIGNLGRLGEPSSIFNMLKKCQRSRFDDSHFNQIYLSHQIHSSYVCYHLFLFLMLLSPY